MPDGTSVPADSQELKYCVQITDASRLGLAEDNPIFYGGPWASGTGDIEEGCGDYYNVIECK